MTSPVNYVRVMVTSMLESHEKSNLIVQRNNSVILLHFRRQWLLCEVWVRDTLAITLLKQCRFLKSAWRVTGGPGSAPVGESRCPRADLGTSGGQSFCCVLNSLSQERVRSWHVGLNFSSGRGIHFVPSPARHSICFKSTQVIQYTWKERHLIPWIDEI
jgi:hypothetical protein